MEWTYPKRLRSGMTIGFCQLHHDSPWIDEVMVKLKILCKARGYDVFIAKSMTYESDLEDVKRAEQFQYMMTTAPCDLVIMLDDIEAELSFLDHLNYEVIGDYRKGFVGRGRCTGIHAALHKHCGLVTYYGPFGRELVGADRDTIDTLFAAVEGTLRVIEPLPEPPRGAIGTELGSGILLGGCMETLGQLTDTPYGVEALVRVNAEDTILLLEDTSLPHHDRDAIFNRWQVSNVLNMIAGVVAGHMSTNKALSHGIPWRDTEEDTCDIGDAALRYMEEDRSFDDADPFVCYVSTGGNGPRYTLPLGADIHFRYISNTIVISPYTKG